MKKPFIVGLTGQSGAGKTLASELFGAAGFAVINADIISRDISQNNKEFIAKVKAVFGNEYVQNQKINRSLLAETVFSDKEKKKLLESLIFPFIMEKIEKEIVAASKNSPYILLDAPTLFEAGAERLCDRVVGILSDEALILGRITDRDKITKQQAKNRILSQNSSEFFREKCDDIIENNTTREDFERKITALSERIKHENPR